MSIKKYSDFLRWYFNYIGNERFDNVSRRNTIKRKERLYVIIVAYIVMICSLVCFLLIHSYYVLFLTLISIMYLHACQFSFLGYLFAYMKFKNKDKSINDDVIFTYGILDGGNSKLLSMIDKYFNFYVTGGNAFAVKISLMAKGKERRKETSHIKKVLKITPNKIYLNRKIIFDNKISDMLDLEKFLIEESSNWN